MDLLYLLPAHTAASSSSPAASSWHSGKLPKPASPPRSHGARCHVPLYLISVVLAVGLMAYPHFALLFPERFS